MQPLGANGCAVLITERADHLLTRQKKKPRIAGRGRKGRKRMEELKRILNGDLSGQDLEVTVTYLQEEQAHA